MQGMARLQRKRLGWMHSYWKNMNWHAHILSSKRKPDDSFLGFFLLLGNFLVFLSDLVELSHVLLEVGAFLQGDEQLSFLAISFVSLDSNGLGFDFLESGIVVSKAESQIKRNFLTWQDSQLRSRWWKQHFQERGIQRYRSIQGISCPRRRRS